MISQPTRMFLNCLKRKNNNKFFGKVNKKNRESSKITIPNIINIIKFSYLINYIIFYD